MIKGTTGRVIMAPKRTTVGGSPRKRPKGASDIFECAIAAAERIGDIQEKVTVLADISHSLAGIGQRDKAVGLLSSALELADVVEDVETRTRVVTTIASAFSRIGLHHKADALFGRAIELSRKVENGRKRKACIECVIDALCCERMWERALDAAELAYDAEEKASKMHLILEFCHFSQSFTLRSDPELNEWELKFFLERLLHAAWINDAVIKVERRERICVSSPGRSITIALDADNHKGTILSDEGPVLELVVSRNRNGDLLMRADEGLDEATHGGLLRTMRAAAECPDPKVRANQRNWLVWLCIERGEVEEAHKIVASMEAGPWKDRAVSDVAWLYDEMRDPERAHELICSMASDREKVRAIVEHSRALSRMGHNDWVEAQLLEAIHVVESMGSTQDPCAVADIAAALAAAGCGAKSNASFSKALDCAAKRAKMSDEEERPKRMDRYLSHIAVKQVCTGSLESAMRTASSIGSEDTRTQTFNGIVTTLTQSGRIDSAFKVVDTVTSPMQKADLLCHIGETLSLSGNEPGALDALHLASQYACHAMDEGESETQCTRLLIRIAHVYSSLGRFELACEAAGRITDPMVGTDSSFDLLVLKLIKAKYHNEVLKLIAPLYDQGLRDCLMHEMALEHAKEGQLKDALDLVESIDSSLIKNSTLSDIAIKESESGHFEQAVSRVQSLMASDCKVCARSEVAANCAAAGRLENALELIKGAQDAAEKARVLHRVAIACSDSRLSLSPKTMTLIEGIVYS